MNHEICSNLLPIHSCNYLKTFITKIYGNDKLWGIVVSLPPANKVCEGYVFTGVCLSTGGVPGRGVCGGHVWQGYACPPRQILRDMVNERAVRILLEYILVLSVNYFMLTTEFCPCRYFIVLRCRTYLETGYLKPSKEQERNKVNPCWNCKDSCFLMFDFEIFFFL